VLSLVMAQRLEKKVCPHCRISVLPEMLLDKANYELIEAWSRFSLHESDQIYIRNEVGCGKCHKGHEGRQLIIELIEIDKPARAFIKTSDWTAWEKHINDTGVDTLERQTKKLLLSGVICTVDALHSLVSE